MFMEVIMSRYSSLDISPLASNVLLEHEGEDSKHVENSMTHIGKWIWIQRQSPSNGGPILGFIMFGFLHLVMLPQNLIEWWLKIVKHEVIPFLWTRIELSLLAMNLPLWNVSTTQGGHSTPSIMLEAFMPRYSCLNISPLQRISDEALRCFISIW